MMPNLGIGSSVDCALYVDISFPKFVTVLENVISKDDDEEVETLAATEG